MEREVSNVQGKTTRGKAVEATTPTTLMVLFDLTLTYNLELANKTTILYTEATIRRNKRNKTVISLETCIEKLIGSAKIFVVFYAYLLLLKDHRGLLCVGSRWHSAPFT